MLSFEEMLLKIIPGVSKESLGRMMAWIKEEEKIHEKAVLNYKMPQVGSQLKKAAKKMLSFQQMRDYIHIFVNNDRNLDGMLSVDEFRKGFERVMTSKQINDLFWDKESYSYKQMNIAQFLEIMKPREFFINKEIVKTQVQDYMIQLLKEKRNALIDKGVNVGPITEILKQSMMNSTMTSFSSKKVPQQQL